MKKRCENRFDQNIPVLIEWYFVNNQLVWLQAKKMNVESLRSNQGNSTETAEVKIAKAAITICFLFVAAWTPYGINDTHL